MTDRKAAAAALFAELRDSLLTAEKVIHRIIDEKAWFDLGYASLFEAWKAELKGVRLASDIARGDVIEQMLSEGVAPQEIVESVAGAGALSVRQAQERMDADYVPKSRKPSSAPRPYVVHAPVTPEEYAAWVAICEADGTTLSEEAARALREWFATDG